MTKPESQLLSLVTGYRNRDLQRVKRFLDSLQAQTFQDFELIFVDYGSDERRSFEISALCRQYGFCRYVFSDTCGKLWNRAHALNIGIHLARGKYFLSADVDLIYSQEVLAHLMSVMDDRKQLFCKAFLLPKSFSNYSSLAELPVRFSLTKPGTLGLFHCMTIDAVKAIGGFDEHYQIWGFEDNDLAMRLEIHGLARQWLDVTEIPIYHQWHREGSIHPFMTWCWEDMTIYDALKDRHQHPQDSWGKSASSDSRPLNLVHSSVQYICPQSMNPFERRESIFQILNLLKTHHETKICIDLYKEPDRTYLQSDPTSRMIAMMTTTANRLSRQVKSRIQWRVADAELHRSESAMLYFFYDLILKSDLLADYRFEDKADRYHFTLLRKQI